MTLALGATWNPRGELPRLLRLRPLLEGVYTGAAVIFPPVADPGVVSEARRLLSPLPGGNGFRWTLVESQEWAWGRHLALQTARDFTASHIQYADMDRLLRWAETRPGEWREAAEAIGQGDCLVIGRTSAAYRTHPQALVQTEAISNQVIASFLGRPMDVSAGSKGFSREAVQFLMAHSPRGNAIGTDGEWPVLMHRGGFEVRYIEVDGLDWESADRFQEEAAGPEAQRRAAAEYDSDPAHWARRVEIAAEIVSCGLSAARRTLRQGENHGDP